MGSAPGSPSDASVARPAPDATLVERVRAWLAWFGVARLAVTAASVVIVTVAGFWLVRAPAPPAEATLPTAVVDPTGERAATGAEAPTASTEPDAPTATPDDDEPAEIVVHVAGNVAEPGVYVLGRERRVHDAIEAAGGPTAQADTERLNLAQVLHDGQRVYVPAPDDVETGSAALVTPDLATDGRDAAPAGPIDVNRADVDALDTLPGVGPSTARAIVDERERNGPFASVDDLERVPGIGPARLDALRDLVVV